MKSHAPALCEERTADLLHAKLTLYHCPCRFTRNDNIIEVHLKELDKQVKDVERETESKRTEYNHVSNDHTRCITEISQLESEQEKCKR